MPSLELYPQTDIQAHLLSLLHTQISKFRVSGDSALFYFLTPGLPFVWIFQYESIADV